MYKTLDRNELFKGSAVPDWATAAACFNEQWYFEESLAQLDGDRFQRVSSGRICKYNGMTCKGFEKAVLFTPLSEQDDPPPPAPESVRYYHWGYYGIDAAAYLDVHAGHFASGPRIRINDKDNRGITIDADTALQLAHDLNRMANEIKRKEKQNAHSQY